MNWNNGENKDKWEGIRIIQAGMAKLEKERRDYVEGTRATLADVEDAVNYVLGELRKIADYMDINDYEFNKK